MKALASVLFLVLVFVCSCAAQQYYWTDISSGSVDFTASTVPANSVYRNWDAASLSTISVDGVVRIVAGRGVRADATDTSRSYDAARFVFSNLGRVQAWASYFGADASIESDGTDGSNTVNFEAAWAAGSWRAWSVVEWEDTNGDGLLQRTEVIGTYNLNDLGLTWQPFRTDIYQVADIDGNTRDVRVVSVQTTDEVVTLRWLFAGGYFNLNGREFGPDFAHMDLAIQWYQSNHVAASWTPGPSDVATHPNARIGVIGGVAAVAGALSTLDDAAGTRDAEYQVSYGAFTTRFTWHRTTEDVTSQGVGAAGAARVTYEDATTDDAASFAGGWIIKVGIVSSNTIRPQAAGFSHTFGLLIDYTKVSPGDAGDVDRVITRTGVVATTVDAATDRIRTMTVAAWPADDPRVIGIVGVRAARSQTTNTITGRVDAIGLSYNNLFQLTLRYGYFAAQASVTLPSTADDGSQASNSLTANLQAAGFGMVLRLFYLFEWVDANGDGAYDPNTDGAPVGFYRLSLAAWKTLVVQDYSVNDAEGVPRRVRIFQSETTDGVFLVRWVVTESPVTVQDAAGRSVVVRPDAVKFDLRVRYYDRDAGSPCNILAQVPFTCQTSTDPNVRLGVVAAYGATGGTLDLNANFQSDRAAEIDTDVDGASTVGRLAWTTQVGYRVNADDTTVQVTSVRDTFVNLDAVTLDGADQLTTAMNAEITSGWVLKAGYWTFDQVRPAELYWDPEFASEIDYNKLDASTTGGSTTSAGSCVVLSLMLVLGAVLALMF